LSEFFPAFPVYSFPLCQSYWSLPFSGVGFLSRRGSFPPLCPDFFFFFLVPIGFRPARFFFADSTRPLSFFLLNIFLLYWTWPHSPFPRNRSLRDFSIHRPRARSPGRFPPSLFRINVPFSVVLLPLFRPFSPIILGGERPQFSNKFFSRLSFPPFASAGLQASPLDETPCAPPPPPLIPVPPLPLSLACPFVGVPAGLRRNSFCLFFFFASPPPQKPSQKWPLERPLPPIEVFIGLWARQIRLLVPTVLSGFFLFAGSLCARQK